jgi:hypothetical protein
MKRAILCLVSLIFLCGNPIDSLRASERHLPVSQTASTSLNRAAQAKIEAEEYKAAVGEGNPTKRAVLLETFLVHHADSAFTRNAFEQALVAYKVLDDDQFQEALSQNQLQVAVENVPAATVMASWVQRLNGPNPILKGDCELAVALTQTAPKWPRPENLSDHEYYDIRNQAEAISNGMAGICASRAYNDIGARRYFLTALRFDPNNVRNLSAVAFEDIKMRPIDVRGFWYGARALNLSPPSHAYPIVESKYEYYHGSREGWDKIMAEAANHTEPPTGFNVTSKKQLEPNRRFLH